MARITLGEDDDMAEDRVTRSLAGLALAVALLVACLFVLRGLQEKSRVEDCIMSGRLNCDRVVGS